MEIPLFFMISFYSIWPPFLCGILTFKKLDNSMRIFFGMISLGVIFEILGRNLSQNNLVVINFWDPIEFALLLAVFSNWTYFTKHRNHFTIVIIIDVLLRIILYLFGFEEIDIIKSYASILGEFAILILGMYAFYKLSKETETLIYFESKFYLLAGILIYYSGITFLNFITFIVPPEDILPFWYIHASVNIIANILYTICFFLQYRNSKVNLS